MIQLQLEILEALFLFVFLLVTSKLAVRWNFENRLDKTFAVVFCHQIFNWPFNSWLPQRIKVEVCWIERMIDLRLKKQRWPPSLKTLQTVPFFGPESLQVEQKDNLLDWVFIGLNGFINFKSSFYQSVDIEIFSDDIDLTRFGCT